MTGNADGTYDASLTISQVLNGYLRAQRARLATRTYTRDAEVISWLEKSLNVDGVNDLTPEDLEQFRSRGFDFERGDPPYCEALGPYYLMVHLPTFLSAAQLRRLGSGPEILDQAGTVVKKLARWLESNNYIPAMAAKAAEQLAADTRRRIAAMAELTQRLDAITQDVADRTDYVPGYFEITHVEPEGIWLLDHRDDTVYGPVFLPDDILDLCAEGWVISGTLGRRGNAYQFVKALNVYP